VTPGVAVQEKKSTDDLTHWQSKTTTVLSRTSFLVNTPELSDVKFIFKTKEGSVETIIYGHKVILAMASPVFQKMFFNQNPNLVTPVEDKAEMKDHPFTAEAFLTFMKFLYTDIINYEAYEGLSTELILGILNCADYYDVPYLKTDCVKQLEKIITSTNVIQILEAALLFNEYDLGCQALEVIDKNLNFVFESEEILTVKLETLLVILSRDTLDVDECFVLDLALKWAEHECKRKSLEPTVENKRKVLGSVFFRIRFALLTSDRIFELVASNLLSLEESLHICLSVHNPGHFTRTSTTPGGSTFSRNATVDFVFEFKPRVFGRKMELMESRKMEEKWKEENQLYRYKSLAAKFRHRPKPR